ncbi:MAG: spermidine/putrescine ABC transporter substrate-binding protein [Anaerolineae bacterium]|nr:spermidine/putrescine ABC transporter substrate-binding protein [Anaerolineae bacterium]
MHKWFTFLLVAAAISLTAAAQDEEEGWTCPSGYEGQTLRIFSWSTYVAEDTIPHFEESCGVTVEYYEFGSNDELMAVIRSGIARYDLAVPSEANIARLIEEGLLQPLDYSIITNVKNVSEKFLDPPYDPGNVYSVPYQWGTAGIAYDATMVDEEITRWEDFFTYEGPVAWIDDSRTMLSVALLLLGYDPNSQNPDEIQAAKDYLLEHSTQVDAVASENGQDMLLRGDVDMVMEWSGDLLQIIEDCDCDDFVYVIPEEGTNIWVDNMAVPANAENPQLAMEFINYILDPQVGADLSNFTAYGSPNQTAIDAGLIDEETLNNPGIYPSEETLEKMYFLLDVGAEADQYYTEVWNELLAALSE